MTKKNVKNNFGDTRFLPYSNKTTGLRLGFCCVHQVKLDKVTTIWEENRSLFDFCLADSKAKL